MDFLKIRSFESGQREAFEELCCQIFRMTPDAPANRTFRRIRGSGGDGGVEAYWVHSGTAAWGIQSKFFRSLAAAQKHQMRASLDQALSTHSNLAHYTCCLPIQLTGRGAGGKQGQIQKLESWIAEWRKIPAVKRRKVEIDWWDPTELSGRLQAIDPSGGRRRYWFDATVLSDAWFGSHLDEAMRQAGRRYSPRLRIDVPASDALEDFGRTERWQDRVESLGKKLAKARESWESCFTQPRRDSAVPEMPAAAAPRARRVSALAEAAQKAFGGFFTSDRFGDHMADARKTVSEAI
jgi:hypothetical protein